MGVWRRRGEAASAGLSAAPYSAHHKLYSEAVVSSVASALAFVEVGRLREAVEYVQKAAKALYEAARDVFEHVRVTAQRLVKLFVETVARVLAWIDEHKAYLFLMTAVAAGIITLSVALDMWGLVELEKLAHVAVGAPFVAGLADAGGKVAERFKTLAERSERWRVDEGLIDEVLKAPLRGETPLSSKRPYVAFLKLFEARRDLPPPLVELREALARKDEVVQDAAVVAALVLYKALVNNAGAYKEWAGWYDWARGLVERQEFTVSAGDIERLREAQKRLEDVAGRVLEELNRVLVLYSQSAFYKERPDLLNKLKQLLEVDLGEAEELAEARVNELYGLGGVNMGTKAYASLLSIARGGLYGHVAMLLMGEGALADLVLSAPATAYERAKDIARGRGEAVDPSYSGRRGRSVGQPSWVDRAASALLRYLLGRADEDLKFRRVREGFEVFRTYGGVESYVDTLKIGKSVRSKAAEEELRRFVEEAKKHKPDLSGMDKAPQYLEWLNTDVSFDKGWIVAATADTRQAAWYVGLLGEEESSRGGASVTKEGVKPNVTMYWPREREDQILKESRWLESLLGRRVESWRELVDAIDWRRVLKRVEELADELKPWIGPERMRDEEREGLARSMLGELALLAYFAEARRGMDGGRWREERATRLSRAVEALSGGRIAGDNADRLAQAIVYYAEGYKEKAEGLIESLAEEVGVSMEEVWGVVDFVLSDMYCLARDFARDAVVRKFVAPALELIMLDKALRGELDREEALLRFGEMYATAIAGDGHVGPRSVVLAVGGELGGGAALLRLATLHMLNQLRPDELEFGVRTYMGEGRYYRIAATGEDAARFMRLLAVSAPSAGGGYLSEKFDRFVEEARVEVRLGNIRLTGKGRVAADLIISEAGIDVKYTVYLLKDVILLHFASSDRSRVELAARLLRLAGVSAEVKKVGDRDEWRVEVTTDKLAAGRKELRDAVRKVVEGALEKGWVDEKKTRRWLEKLEEGLTLREGWPKYHVGVARSGSLVVRYHSTNPDNIVREAQRLRDVGLVEGVHFSVKMPEGGEKGYVSILRKGLERAAWLSIHGEVEQLEPAADFVEYILRRAEEEGKEVSEKAKEIVEEGRSRGSLKLKGFEKEVEVEGKKHVVKVINGGAEFKRGRDGRKLLRIRITAEVDSVRREYAITFGRYGEDNAAMGFAYASIDAPGGREADAERFSALVEALTGKRPRVYRMNNGRIKMECYKEHLDGFARFAELADAIEKWLEETDRRTRWRGR
jgi:hypothetical protein